MGNKVRRIKDGIVLMGVEAVPPYIWTEAARASDSAARRAQDLGLDLTGRVRALKDDAIRQSLSPDTIKQLQTKGRKLRNLRGMG